MTKPTKLTSNLPLIRYLVVVPMMDIACPDLVPGAEPTAYSGTLDAASLKEAQILAEEFAIELARDRSAWVDEAEGLPFAGAQDELRANGLYVGDPIVEPLATLTHITSAPGES